MAGRIPPSSPARRQGFHRSCGHGRLRTSWRQAWFPLSRRRSITEALRSCSAPVGCDLELASTVLGCRPRRGGASPPGSGGPPYDPAGAGPACRAEDEGVPNPSGGHRRRRCTSGPCAAELLDHAVLVLAPDPTNHSCSIGRIRRPSGPKLGRSVTSGGDGSDDGVKEHRRTGARGDHVATDRSRGAFPRHRGSRHVHAGPSPWLATASTSAGARRAATARAHDGLDDGTPAPAALSRPPRIR